MSAGNCGQVGHTLDNAIGGGEQDVASLLERQGWPMLSTISACNWGQVQAARVAQFCSQLDFTTNNALSTGGMTLATAKVQQNEIFLAAELLVDQFIDEAQAAPLEDRVWLYCGAGTNSFAHNLPHGVPPVGTEVQVFQASTCATIKHIGKKGVVGHVLESFLTRQTHQIIFGDGSSHWMRPNDLSVVRHRQLDGWNVPLMRPNGDA